MRRRSGAVAGRATGGPARRGQTARTFARRAAAVATLAGSLGAIASPAHAGAAPQPASVSISPAAGPVGSVVQVGVHDPEPYDCTNVVFEHAGGPTGGTVGVPGPTGAVGHFVVPSVLVPSGSGRYPAVTAGAYVFSVTCGSIATGGFVTTTADFTVTSATLPPSRFVGMAPTPDGKGYWLAQADGGVFTYGDAHFDGALPPGRGGLGIVPAAPIVGIAATPTGGGYWLAGADGGVFSFGDAHFYGSLPGIHVTPRAPIVGIAANPAGGGYWLIGADGGVFAFGSARFFGPISSYEPRTVPPFVGLSPTGSGTAYFRVSASGWAAGFGSTQNAGVTVGIPGVFQPQGTQTAGLAGLISGIAVTSSGTGMWLVGSEGAVFAIGAPLASTGVPPPFCGSLPGIHVVPRAPIVGIAATPDDKGYWLVGADGGVFSFGDAHFYGSAGDSGLAWES